MTLLHIAMVLAPFVIFDLIATVMKHTSTRSKQ